MTVGNENRLDARAGQRRRREGKVQGRLGPVPPAINRNGQALEGISDSDTATGQGKGVARRIWRQLRSENHATAGSSLHGNAVHIELNRYSHVLADGFGGKGPVGQTGGHCPLN